MSDKPAASTPLTIESIMTVNVHRVSPEMTVRDAINVLISNDISGAPVCDSLGKVISVVSEGDLLKLAATDGLGKAISFCLQKLVKTDKLVTLKKNSSFSEAYKTFLLHPVRRLVIVDSNGKLQGIVSRSNVLKVLCAPVEPAAADAATATAAATPAATPAGEKNQKAG